MLAALAERFPEDEWLAFVPGRTPLRASPGVRLVRGRLPSRVLFGSAVLAGRPTIDGLVGKDVDVVWIPAPAPVAVSSGTPYVLTVHDLSWVSHPEWFTGYERAWHRVARLERLAARAARVVTVSHATKREVLEHWPAVAPDLVRVVHSGVRKPHPAPELGPGFPDRFFLAVGPLEPRKAPELLAGAHARAEERGLDAALLFVGRGPTLRRRLDPPHLQALEDVSDELLDALYAHAIALVMPSFHEGFAFPTLEAATLGTPSIVRDLPVYDETLGDAALRVSGGEEEWAQALLTIADDDDRRAELGRRAQRAAERFTWERAADELHGVLAEAAAE